MNYRETIEFLYNALPMFSRMGATAIKKDITNTAILCNRLGNPQQCFKSVHIAGTNGKGSVSHMLASVLQTAGHKTGLYTSPHLKDFRERIRVNGVMIDESFVISFTQKIRPWIEELKPSFFEITVAMMFAYFKEKQVDVAVIETGLGGRLDSTNIVHPELSVITNIGLDHIQILGNTLQEIAFEKAGIIKPGVPVVVGEAVPETKAVFETVAAGNQSSLIWAQEHRYAESYHYAKRLLTVDVVHLPDRELRSYQLDLPGIYQIRNLITVLAATDQLKKSGWKISDPVINTALGQVKKLTGLHGRWEIVRQEPAVVLDVAHNEDGMKQIAEQLEITDYHHLHIVIGMVKDKEIDKALQRLPKDATYYFTKAAIPRALPENRLAEIGIGYGLNGNHYPSVSVALQTALDHAGKKDMILVCGSVFVVGEVNSV